MLKRLIAIAFVAVLAIGGGTALTYYSIRGADRFGAVTLDGWTAFPIAGTPEADPYSKARLARDAALALGIAEGVTFYSDQDEAGSPYSGSCTYVIEGATPPARFWTLNLVDNQRRPIPVQNPELPATLHSASIAYEANDAMIIRISPKAREGNWLAAPANMRFAIALTLFDSPIASNKGLIDTAFPRVRKAGCLG